MLKTPKQWVSVLICSYNTCRVFLRECLDSIKAQNGVFGIEVVWINDGSDAEHTAMVEEELALFKRRSRFCKVVYQRTAKNEGVASALNRGIDLCSHDLIFRMDSDDIMVPNRIKTQLDFMKQNPECVCCGSNMSVFTNVSASISANTTVKKTIQTATEHPYCIQWERLCAVYKEHGGIPAWFMNHPTLCYKKDVVVSLGKYDTTVGSLEDYELELRILKQHGVVYNIQENLLMYRSHVGQVTRDMDKDDTVDEIRQGILQRVFGHTNA
jgi:glycosyltransferase involved in cell wall biosynthesis